MKVLLIVAIHAVACINYGFAGGAPNLEPFTVHLDIVVGNKHHSCDGAIVAPKFVLTAGHCVHNDMDDVKPTLRVNLPSSLNHAGKYAVTHTFHLHPQFNALIHDFDAALIEMDSPLNLDGVNAMAVKLPSQGFDVSERSSVYTAVNVGGSSTVLSISAMTVLACQKAYGSDEVSITYRMFCGVYAGKVQPGACNGNAGAPALDSQGVMVGMLFDASGCQKLELPGIYLDVGEVRNWITKTAGV